MQIQQNDSIPGIYPGLLSGQHERVDELNDRIYSRFVTDSPLQPNFDTRPISTKYSHFPIINRRKIVNTPLPTYLEYSMDSNFAPTSSNAPVDGYLKNVNVESSLRNQYFAIQKGLGQGLYIPSSTSELYNDSVPVSSQSVQQPYPDLFTQPSLNTEMRNQNENIGKDRFFNHTRNQLRESNVYSR